MKKWAAALTDNFRDKTDLLFSVFQGQTVCPHIHVFYCENLITVHPLLMFWLGKEEMFCFYSTMYYLVMWKMTSYAHDYDYVLIIDGMVDNLLFKIITLPPIFIA